MMRCRANRSWWAVWLPLLALAGCADDDVVPATQITVSLNSDITALRHLDVQVFAVDEDDEDGEAPVDERPFTIASGDPDEGEVELPFSFGIARAGQQRFRLVVTGYDSEREELIEQQAVVSFRDRETLLLKIFLAASCLSIGCDDDETCRDPSRDGDGEGGARCYDAERDDLERIDPGDDEDAWRPGASDGGTNDAGGSGGSGGSGGEDGGPATGGTGGGSGGSGGEDAGAPTGGMGGSGGEDAAMPEPDAAADGGVVECDPACEDGESCDEGRCVCEGGTTTYYRDSDGDDHGNSLESMEVCGDPPDGYVRSDDDCCDLDPLAYPGQDEPQEEPMECPAGQFDYDCDGYNVGWPSYASGTCCVSWTDGWQGSIPACGEYGTFIQCNTSTCYPDTFYLPQVCL